MPAESIRAFESARHVAAGSVSIAPDFDRRVYCLFGLPVDAVDQRQAIAVIGQALRDRSRLFFSTPNLNFLVASRTDRVLRNSVVRSDLSVCDGMPLVWMARVLGIPVTQRVTGSDLFEAMRRGEAGTVKVFFFGGPDGVAATACERITADAGPMRCVGALSPGFGSIEDMSGTDTIAAINATGADFVVVSLGTKRGQAWIERNRQALDAPLISYLGAVINFAAGGVARAPSLMRRSGFEWLWRIKEEPTLWRRYFGDGVSMLRLILLHLLPLVLERWIGRGIAPGRPARCEVASSTGSTTVVRLSGTWADADLGPLRTVFSTIASESREVTLDLSALDRVDSAFIALLMLLHCHQSNRRLALHVIAPRPSIRVLFRLHCATYLLDESLSTGNDGRG